MDLETLRGNTDITAYSEPEGNEETLIIDERGCLSPSEQVDRKLIALVGEGAVPVSQLNAPRWVRR